MAFVEKLEKILDERGITPYRIFTDIGIGVNSINNWKKGSVPKIDTLEKICLYLEVDPKELLDLGDNFLDADQNLFELNGEEEYLIDMFRKCSPGGKIAVREYAAFEASRAKSFGCGPDEELQA